MDSFDLSEVLRPRELLPGVGDVTDLESPLVYCEPMVSTDGCRPFDRLGEEVDDSTEGLELGMTTGGTSRVAG